MHSFVGMRLHDGRMPPAKLEVLHLYRWFTHTYHIYIIIQFRIYSKTKSEINKEGHTVRHIKIHIVLLFNGFSQWPLQNPLVWYLVEICRHQVCFTAKSSLLGANLLIYQILGDFGRSTCSRKQEPVYNGQQNVQLPKLGIPYYIYNILCTIFVNI